MTLSAAEKCHFGSFIEVCSCETCIKEIHLEVRVYSDDAKMRSNCGINQDVGSVTNNVTDVLTTV